MTAGTPLPKKTPVSKCVRSVSTKNVHKILGRARHFLFIIYFRVNADNWNLSYKLFLKFHTVLLVGDDLGEERRGDDLGEDSDSDMVFLLLPISLFGVEPILTALKLLML